MISGDPLGDCIAHVPELAQWRWGGWEFEPRNCHFSVTEITSRGSNFLITSGQPCLRPRTLPEPGGIFRQRQLLQFRSLRLAGCCPLTLQVASGLGDTSGSDSICCRGLTWEILGQLHWQINTHASWPQIPQHDLQWPKTTPSGAWRLDLFQHVLCSV